MPHERIIDGELHLGSGVEGRRGKRQSEVSADQRATPDEVTETQEAGPPGAKRDRQGKPVFNDDAGADIFYSAPK
jgi:hypothetical protein